MIPVMFGLQHFQDVNTDQRRYLGFGIGAAFTTLDVPDQTGAERHDHTTLYGAYIRAGMEFSKNLMLDGRYYFLQDIHGANPSGPEVTFGVEF